MSQFFSNMSGSIRIALVFIFLAGALALTVAWSSDFTTKITLSFICGAMIFGALRLATPNEARIIWLRHASLIVGAGAASSLIFFKDWVNSFWLSLAQRVNPSFELSATTPWLSAFALLSVVAVIWIVNRGNTLNTATVRTRLSILDHPDNRTDRDQLITDLGSYIDRLDEEYRWKRKEFIELEADIDLVLGNERRRSAGNLLQAVQKNAMARLFVVLGEPGSGKSVALRTLTRSLLAQASKGGQIPVYVNLREWQGSIDELTKFEETKVSPVAQFLRRTLRGQLSDVSYEFILKNFERLQSEGQFFFILDSFDEIPAILDSDESKELTQSLSEQLYLFLLSGKGARGLIASRYFRQPTIRKSNRCVLELRPFNEERIAQYIDRQAVNPKALKHRIFVESALLGSVARSPFLLSLILDYEKHHSSAVPDNQAELFRSYIEQVLKEYVDKLDFELKASTLASLCERIAWIMFDQSDLGLEVPRPILSQKMDFQGLDEVLEGLRNQRLFRISESGQLSFAHRRFQEYFIVRGLLEKPNNVPLEAIVEDSRWRDSMVLYAEIVPDLKGNAGGELGTNKVLGKRGGAERIAFYCWKHIQLLVSENPQSNPKDYLRGLNALRFLGEAFRSRPHVVEDFRKPLTEQVVTLLLGKRNSDEYWLNKYKGYSNRIPNNWGWTVDLLNARYAVESIVFLPKEDSADVLKVVLQTQSSWITEVAFRSCRYLGQVPKSVVEALQSFVVSFTFKEIRQRNNVLKVALSFHDQFRPVRRSLLYTNMRRQVYTLAFWGLLVFATPVWIFLLSISLGYNLYRRVLSSSISEENKQLNRFSIIDFFSHGFKPLKNVIGLILLSVPMTMVIIISPIPAKYLVAKISVWWPQIWFLYDFLSIFIPLISLGIVSLVLFFDIGKISFRRLWRNFVYGLYSDFFFIRKIFNVRTLSIVLVFFLVMALVSYLNSKWTELAVGLLLLIFGSAVVIVFIRGLLYKVYETYKRIANVFKDHYRLQRVIRVFASDRNIIASHFLSFKTEFYRSKYIVWLEEQVLDQRDRERLASSDNLWPNGVRPNVENNDASARLAQLDARWIGIE